MLVAAASVLLASGALASHWRVSNLVAVRTAPSALTALGSVAELQQQFNADHGTARLVLLLSPT